MNICKVCSGLEIPNAAASQSTMFQPPKLSANKFIVDDTSINQTVYGMVMVTIIIKLLGAFEKKNCLATQVNK